MDFNGSVNCDNEKKRVEITKERRIGRSEEWECCKGGIDSRLFLRTDTKTERSRWETDLPSDAVFLPKQVRQKKNPVSHSLYVNTLHSHTNSHTHTHTLRLADRPKGVSVSAMPSNTWR